MATEQYDFLQNLYKNLRSLDIELLKGFGDLDISDNDYFILAIESDIVSNASSVVCNYLTNNLNSVGVDISCRAIIEAIVILLMNNEGKISEKQKTIFRYLYSYVDLNNFKSMIKEQDKQNELFQSVLKDNEKCRDAICEHFKCSSKELADYRARIYDPHFYLKHKLDERISFDKLAKQYNLLANKYSNAYQFFSLFIHPRCEMNQEVEESILKIRIPYIDEVLRVVFEFLKTNNLFIYKKDAKDFDEEFFKNPVLHNNIHNIKQVDLLFSVLKDRLCLLKNGDDMFTWHFLEKCRYIATDMMISESLGYKEHIISLFKSFVEEYAMVFRINSADNLNDFNFLKKAYWFTSRLQLNNHFSKLWKCDVTPINEIEELYNNYYKEKYNLNNFQEFYNNLKSNSLYFIDKDDKNYTKHVKAAINTVFIDEPKINNVMAMYKVSLDIGHASGYSFNASEGIIDAYPLKMMIYFWYIIEHYILLASLTIEQHGEKCSVKDLVKFINNILDDTSEKLVKIHESYGVKSSKVNLA